MIRLLGSPLASIGSPHLGDGVTTELYLIRSMDRRFGAIGSIFGGVLLWFRRRGVGGFSFATSIGFWGMVIERPVGMSSDGLHGASRTPASALKRSLCLRVGKVLGKEP
jgi:hypothetical protein